MGDKCKINGDRKIPRVGQEDQLSDSRSREKDRGELKSIIVALRRGEFPEIVAS
jgi:hypothetical protein